MGAVVEFPVHKPRLTFYEGSLRQRGPADPFVAAMKRAGRHEDRLILAVRALRHDPDCIEANLVVAAACTDVERRLAYLNIAVEAGDELWGFLKGDVSLSVVEGARPWLEAIMALGTALAEDGDVEAASECFDRLRELDASDVLQARDAQVDPVRPAAIGRLP